jgi:glycosyltransferase involved in cell wall biosynthesis
VAAGVDLDFVMIGPDDDGFALSGQRIHYYGSQPRAVVLGALASARCLVNMSDSESFGIVLLESWMAGRPVIANRSTAAFAELVEDGRNGFLADGVEDVARGIQRYLLEPELARQHGSAGRQDAMKYEWNVLADGILSSILGVCGGDSDAS